MKNVKGHRGSEHLQNIFRDFFRDFLRHFGTFGTFLFSFAVGARIDDVSKVLIIRTFLCRNGEKLAGGHQSSR